MNSKENQEGNQNPKPKEEKSPLNKGDEFMLRRRLGKEPEPKENTTIVLNGGKAMDMAVVLTLSTLITIGGTIIGFVIGWFANSYYLNYIEVLSDGKETEESIKLTAHPEMMDENGNPIPFQIAKLISVEFDEKDAFTRDPFTDTDD